jgi:hypothetical protein
MNCLRFTTRTGLVVLVAVLIVGGMMPAIAAAAEKAADKEVALFDPFALDVMFSASGVVENAPVIPQERTTVVLRSPALWGLQHPKLFSPFRPGPF